MAFLCHLYHVPSQAMKGLRGYILVAGSVETDPTDSSVGSLVVPAVGKSGLHTSPQ